MANQEKTSRPALSDGQRRYYLGLSGSTLIGKQGCAILLADPSVALQHARLQPDPAGFSIEPVGAEVLINNLPISGSTLLKPGDVVRLGNTTLTYEGPNPEEAGQAPVLSYDQLFEKVKNSVVGIRTPGGLGSGFYIHASGLIVSNRHVVGYESEVEVYLADGKKLTGNVLRSFPEIDLAFLRTDVVPNFVPSVASAGLIRVGQAVLVIGHPMGLANTLTRGIISALNREVMGNTFLQTDAAINPGNSGGPLFNESGNVVGIATMGLGHSQGLNFAIPAELVRQKLEQFLAEETRVQRGQGVYCIVCGYFSLGGVYCPNCGVTLENQNETKFVQLGSAAQCGNCGKALNPGDQFCAICGTHI